MTPAIATIVAAAIAASVVLFQIGRQAKNAIQQNRHNEALKLRLEVYKDIGERCGNASNAIDDLCAFIDNFHSALALARQTQTELNGYAVPTAHPSQFIDKESQLHSSIVRLMAITEMWQIVSPRMDISRATINKVVHDIDAASQSYFEAAYRAMPIAAPPGSWKPPSAVELQGSKDLGDSLIKSLTKLQSCISAFLGEMQTVLVGEMFEMSELETTSINWRRGALRLWVIAAVVWCASVFSVGPWVSQIETAPVCKNGASSCEPWERDWSERRLASGSVVKGQGTIVQPNGVSAWEIIGAATPWIIAPPLAVLALGASLFWAFAGFRRGPR